MTDDMDAGGERGSRSPEDETDVLLMMLPDVGSPSSHQLSDDRAEPSTEDVGGELRRDADSERPSPAGGKGYDSRGGGHSMHATTIPREKLAGKDHYSSSQDRQDTKDSGWDRQDTKHSSRDRKDTKHSSRDRQDTKHSSTDRQDTKHSSTDRQDTERSSRDSHDTKESNRGQDTKTSSRDRKDTKHSSKDCQDTKYTSRYRHDTKDSSEVPDDSKRSGREDHRSKSSKVKSSKFSILNFLKDEPKKRQHSETSNDPKLKISTPQSLKIGASAIPKACPLSKKVPNWSKTNELKVLNESKGPSDLESCRNFKTDPITKILKVHLVRLPPLISEKSNREKVTHLQRKSTLSQATLPESQNLRYAEEHRPTNKDQEDTDSTNAAKTRDAIAKAPIPRSATSGMTETMASVSEPQAQFSKASEPDAPPSSESVPDAPPSSISVPDGQASKIVFQSVSVPDAPPSSVSMPDAPPSSVSMPDAPPSFVSVPDAPPSIVSLPDAPPSDTSLPEEPPAEMPLAEEPTASALATDQPPSSASRPNASNSSKCLPDEPTVSWGVAEKPMTTAIKAEVPSPKNDAIRSTSPQGQRQPSSPPSEQTTTKRNLPPEPSKPISIMQLPRIPRLKKIAANEEPPPLAEAPVSTPQKKRDRDSPALTLEEYVKKKRRKEEVDKEEEEKHGKEDEEYKKDGKEKLQSISTDRQNNIPPTDENIQQHPGRKLVTSGLLSRISQGLLSSESAQYPTERIPSESAAAVTPGQFSLKHLLRKPSWKDIVAELKKTSPTLKLLSNSSQKTTLGARKEVGSVQPLQKAPSKKIAVAVPPIPRPSSKVQLTSSKFGNASESLSDNLKLITSLTLPVPPKQISGTVNKEESISPTLSVLRERKDPAATSHWAGRRADRRDRWVRKKNDNVGGRANNNISKAKRNSSNGKPRIAQSRPHNNARKVDDFPRKRRESDFLGGRPDAVHHPKNGSVFPGYGDRLSREPDRFPQDRHRFLRNNDRFPRDKDRFPRGEDRFLRGDDRFQRDEDRFQRDEDRFQRDEDRFQRDEDRFQRDEDRFQRDEDRFPRDEDRFLRDDRFSRDEDRFPRGKDRFPRGKDRFPRHDDRIPRDEDRFLPAEDRFPRAEDSYPKIDDGLFYVKDYLEYEHDYVKRAYPTDDSRIVNPPSLNCDLLPTVLKQLATDAKSPDLSLSEFERKRPVLRESRDSCFFPDPVTDVAMSHLPLFDDFVERMSSAERLGASLSVAENRPLSCKLCGKRKIEVALFPCGHSALCLACSSGLGRCPFCLCRIREARRIILPSR